jgi:eukaryotic-like serine/threonine-protein kinase
MKYCPKCQNSFIDEYNACPNDGTSLVYAGEEDSMMRELDNICNGETSPGLDSAEIYDTPQTMELSEDEFDPNKIIGKMIEGKYQVLSLLGQGGMGAVFRARHTFIKNDVALKIINPRMAMSNDMAERFLREARAAAMIDHPNAIKVTDFGRADDMLYLVMEFVQGISLRNLLRKEGYLSPAKTADIMVQVCAALDAAHSHNIIHRDLKPDNIMIKQNDLGQLVVKVLDFGLAKIRTPDKSSLTGAGIILGTFSYMSPEQCSGERVIDQHTDIYSLGVVAFEMLTGQLPFIANTFAGFLSKHIFETPPSLRTIRPEIPEGVDQAVLRTLEKEPEARHKSAGEFATELARAAYAARSQSPSVDQQIHITSKYTEAGKSSVTKPGERTNISDDAHTAAYKSGAGAVENRTGKIEKMDTSLSTDTRTERDEVKAEAKTIPRRRIHLYIGLSVVLLLLLGGSYFFISKLGQRGPAQAGSQKIDSSAPGMLLIKGGWLKMGTLEGYDYEQPMHEVYVDSFYIDETEVTNEQFEKFVLATGHKTEAEIVGNEENSWKAYATPERKNHPVVLVSWDDAAAYAKWAGKRLPTEAEWEYAARGGLIGQKYPWGDDPPPRHANFGRGRKPGTPPTEPVKSYEPNGYGLYDMAGNVSEWCQDWFDPKYYSSSPERNPAGPSTGQSRVIRGGSWYTDFNQIRVSSRISELPGGYEYDRGFRCAKSR